jgi:hypothetical protein
MAAEGMIMKSDNSITKRWNRALTTARLAIAMLLFATTPVFAHGGFDHVRGTVVKITNHVLTVRTPNGNIEVKLNDKTELTKNDRKAALADLVPGARVVVDVPEGNKDNLAHSVKIGVGGKIAAPHAKDLHK